MYKLILTLLFVPFLSQGTLTVLEPGPGNNLRRSKFPFTIEPMVKPRAAEFDGFDGVYTPGDRVSIIDYSEDGASSESFQAMLEDTNKEEMAEDFDQLCRDTEPGEHPADVLNASMTRTGGNLDETQNILSPTKFDRMKDVRGYKQTTLHWRLFDDTDQDPLFLEMGGESVRIPRQSKEDKEQFRAAGPIDTRYLEAFSPEGLADTEGGASDEKEGEAHAYCGTIILNAPFAPATNEASLLKNSETSIDFHDIMFNGSAIGRVIGPEHDKLATMAKEAENLYGGPGQSKNLLVASVMLISEAGEITNLGSFINNLLFVSGKYLTNRMAQQSIWAIDDANEYPCCSPLMATGAPSFEKQKKAIKYGKLMGRDILVQYADDLPPVLKTTGDLRIFQKPTKKLKGDALKEVTTYNRQHTRAIENVVAQILQGSYTYFPETTLTRLRDTICKNGAHEAEFKEAAHAAATGNFSAMIELLGLNKVDLIASHTESTLVRLFETEILQEIQDYFDLRRDAPTRPHAVILNLASLRDCCFWCLRALTNLANKPLILRDGTELLFHVLVTSTKSHQSFHFQTPDADAVSYRDREYITPAEGPVDMLKSQKILFQFGS